jgi:putative membrane protein
MDQKPEQDPRIYFAAERTFLAWIRTGLGLMGVGFAVSRFGLFLREMSTAPHHSTMHSVATGVMLVVLGVAVLIAAMVQHLAVTRRLAEGTFQPGRPSWLGVIFAGILVLCGIVLAIFILRLG